MKTVLEEWRDRNPRSLEYHQRARKVLSDGVTQDVRAEAPFPVTIGASDGHIVETIDGDELVCYVMGHGSLLLGHSHPAVVEAVQSQAARALHYGGSHQAEAEWAERIVDLIPSGELVRFTSSGTESTMLACRLARAATGRDRLVKINGHFSGWHDALIRGFALPFNRRFAGVPDPVFDRTTSVQPDLDELRELLVTGEIAALVIEPAGGYSGAVPIPEELVSAARQICDDTGTLLVFDEVVTGFRWAPGGAQEVLGINPDLTTLGKIVAGGLPGGAVTGPERIMKYLGSEAGASKVIHTGTHNGHPLAATAGITTLDIAANGGPQRAADRACADVMAGFNGILAEAGVAGLAYGASSHFCILVGVPELAGIQDASEVAYETLRLGTPPAVLAALNCAMMLHGVHLFHGHGFVSSAHNEESTRKTIEAFGASIERLKAEGVV